MLYKYLPVNSMLLLNIVNKTQYVTLGVRYNE